MSTIPTPDERLHAAADLFMQRNAAYGANYLQIGDVLHTMFPHGLTVRTPSEWRRLFMMIHRMTKETRYAQNMASGRGHGDSMEDLAVYAMMANETDEISAAEARALGPHMQKPMSEAEMAAMFAPDDRALVVDQKGIHEVSLVEQGALLSGDSGMREVPLEVPVAVGEVPLPEEALTAVPADNDASKKSSIHQTPISERLVPRQHRHPVKPEPVDPPEASGSCEWRN